MLKNSRNYSRTYQNNNREYDDQRNYNEYDEAYEENESDNERYGGNNEQQYSNESDDYDNNNEPVYNSNHMNSNNRARPGTGQVGSLKGRKDRYYNQSNDSNDFKPKRDSYNRTDRTDLYTAKPKNDFNKQRGMGDFTNKRNQLNNVSKKFPLNNQKKPISRQLSFDNKTLRGNQFAYEHSKPKTNSFDETPIRPLKHNPFIEDSYDRSNNQTKPRRMNSQKDNFNSFQRNPKKSTRFDINFNEEENFEPRKPVQNRPLPISYKDYGRNNHRTTPAIEDSYRRPTQLSENDENMNQLVVARQNAPLIMLRPNSSNLQLYQSPILNKTLILVDPSEIPFTARSLSERAAYNFEEENVVIMKTPRTVYYQQEIPRDGFKIKRVIESHSSPQSKTLTPLIEMSPNEVNFEIVRRRSAVRTLSRNHFS